jgi:hypothetical protein
MENTTTDYTQKRLTVATHHAFNVSYVVNDVEFDDTVSKAELIRKLREEFRKYTEANDRLFNQVVKEFNEGL